MSNQIHNPIPEYADSGWTQPHRSKILVTDETATMPRHVFDLLKEYSHSTPSGQSNGKMWKLRHEDHRNMEVTWYLRWYEIKQNYVYCYSRKIIIADWQKLLGD